ncbi:hypothetical protein [Xanthobacter autotrophicus]|uniref:hypothetical protein n=1 Tax=Xanthobacter autotrophicus TaxID=280 RepID=UPI00372BD8B9
MTAVPGGGLVAEVSGTRCYTEFVGGNSAPKTHTFLLSDEIEPKFSSDPPNRIVLEIYDEFGVRPGQFYDYTFTLSQSSRIVEVFNFRIENRTASPIYRHQFVISNNPDPSKRDSQGGFVKKDRPVGGTYLLASASAAGRPYQATIRFPISNNATVLTLCPAD